MASRRKQSNPRSFKADGSEVSVGYRERSQETGESKDGAREPNLDADNPSPVSAGNLSDANSEDAFVADSDSNSKLVCDNEEREEDNSSEAGEVNGIPSSGSASKEFPYTCSYCDKAFSKFSYVRDHELIHSDEMPYQCEFCQRPFRHKRSRDRHMKLHTGDRNYKCALCDAAFSRSDHLKNHMKSHSNGRWLSTSQLKAGEYSSSGKSIESPSIDHSQSNTPKEMQSCQLCGATFSNYYDLDEHLKGHALTSADANTSQSAPDSSSVNPVLPVKPLEYHCTHCAKQSLKQVFASLLALEQHVTHMHSGKGLSLLSCPHCEAAFPTVPTLNDHIEREHSKVSNKPTSSSADSQTAASWVQSKDTTPVQSSLIKLPQFSVAETLSGDSRASTSSLSNMNVDTTLCYICKRSFSSPAEVMSHIFIEHAAPTLRTPNSSSGATEAKESSTPLDLSSRSPTTSPVVCHICGESFTSSSLLIEHTQASHWEILKSKCNVCSEVVTSPHQHLEHMERHYLSTRRQYICRCCKETFSLVDDLQTHLLAEHSRKIYKCLLCADLFHTDIDLKIHLTVEHSNENKTYKCACCGHPFDDITTWRTHMLQMHIDLVLPSSVMAMTTAKKDHLQCPYCVLTFRTEAEVNLHVLTHQRSFQCSLCGEGFAVEYLRDKHMQKEHSRQLPSDARRMSTQTVAGDVTTPFQCGICDRVFHSEEVYEEHKRKSHSSVKPWQNRQADKSSINGTNSSSATLIQTKMFSTACSTCGKAFKTYSELDKHSRVHFGPVSLTCVICDEICSSLAEMAKHKLQHCKVPSTRPCILCQVEITTADEYIKHSHMHIESDSTIICCVCKHKITSQVELDLHSEFHFPKKPALSCASCKKVCPYFIPLPPQLTENPQFLLCQECLLTRKQSTSIILPNRLMPLPSVTPDVNSPRSPSVRQSTSSSSTLSLSRDQTVSVGSQLVSSPPLAGHRCTECNMKFESVEEMDNHTCMHKPCASCQKTYKISDLVCKLDSYICTSCDSVPKDLWKCDKCKLTFTREEKYQKHNCIALGDGKACSLCQGRFNHSQLLLRGNKLVCKSCDKKLRTCRVCSEAYIHTEGHMCRLRCENCREMFNTTSQTAGKEPALCNLCANKSKSDSVFESTNSRQGIPTNNGKIYQCIQCQKACESESEIKIHILTYHMNDKAHKCYLCSAMFITPAKLQAHLVAHNFGFSDRMSCPKCDWVTSDPATLLSHCASEHSVTNRSYVCAYCLQSFFFETELLNHSSAQHGGMTSMYRPSSAPSSAAEQLSRKRPHSDGHYDNTKSLPKIKLVKSEALSDNDDNDELFCSKCDVEFASLDQYRNHLNLHHNETIRSCPWCNRLYCCQEDLKEHMTSCREREKRRPSDEVFSNGFSNSMHSSIGPMSASPRYNTNSSPVALNPQTFNSGIKSRLCGSPQSVCKSPQQNSSYRVKSDSNSDDSLVDAGFQNETLVISTSG